MVFLTYGCTKIFMSIYGVKKPQVESDSSLCKFLGDIRTNSDHLFVCKDSISYNYFLRLKIGVPEAEFYDNTGHFINYKDTLNTNCNAGVDLFFDSIINTKVSSLNRDFIGNKLKYIVDSKSHNSISFDSLFKADYYVIIYFTKWSGKRINREHIRYWINKIDETNKTDVKMTYILLSVDYMDFW
jgi:hypothetical protein